MEVIKGTSYVEIKEPTVISLGKFDGFHRGHHLLLEEMKKRKEKGLASVVFTFDVPPRKVIRGENQGLLSTQEEKEALFSQSGVDYFVEYPFNKEIQTMEPVAFLRFLTEKLQVRCIVAGEDFCFGYQRAGNQETLRKYARELGYEAVIVPKMCYENREISSTFIREALEEGKISLANVLLGYPYFFEGKVQHGQAVGRRMGIPTLNLSPSPGKLVPAFGVYATRTRVAGKDYLGITNIGRKPTVGDHPVGIETHLLEGNGDFYGEKVRIELLEYIREERKFSSLEELREQIEKDKTYVMNRKLF